MNFVGSKAVAVYPPEITLIPTPAQTISFETFFWCFSLCIAALLLMILMDLIYGGND